MKRNTAIRFEHCDLDGATFRDCDLSSVHIEQCKLEGMRIEGVLVSDLLALYRRQRSLAAAGGGPSLQPVVIR